MMQEWFTAKELADLKLPEMPTTQQGIDKKAKAEKWPSRQRIGRGGGREYHIAVLPNTAFDALHGDALDHMKGRHLNVPVTKSAPEPVTNEQKAFVRRTMVSIFDEYRVAMKLPIFRAEVNFIDMFTKHRAQNDLSVFSEIIFRAIHSLSIQTLRRWRNAVANDTRESLGLAYGKRKGNSALAKGNNGEVGMMIAAVIVTHPQLKPGHIRDLVRAQFGDTLVMKNQTTGAEYNVPLPTIRSFERHIAQWKADNSQVFRKMTNPDGYKNSHQMALGSQSQIADGLNSVWEIDASPTDALCADGRYTIYAIIDVWSRRAMFYVSKTAKTDASLQMVRRAIMAWGVPKIIKTDNGSDFVSHRFSLVLKKSLEIEHKTCKPYTPEGKPHVERVIKTVQHQLMPLLPGYIGHNVAERSQIESRKTFAKRLGEKTEKIFSVSMTHEELQDYLNRWATDKYSHAAHGGLDGISPFAKAASWQGEIRRVASERALDLLLAPIAGEDGIRVISKKGIKINGRQYFGAALELHARERVLVRHDPEDTSKVYVFKESGDFLCEANDFEALPQDEQIEQATRARLNQKNYINNQVAEIKQAAKEYDLTPVGITKAILDQAKADNVVVELPRPSVSYQTSALDAAEEAIVSSTSRPSSFRDMAPVPKKLSDSERLWERRKRILQAQLGGKEVSDTDVKWLEFYETTPSFLSRQHLEEMRASYEVENEDV